MSAAQVPLWVPLVVAGLGFAGVLGAQLIAGRREDRRWAREQEREELRWRREREREQHDRSYQGRLDAYSRVIGALEAWGWALYPIKHAVLDQGRPLTERQREELHRLRDLALDALGPMNLFAPAELRELMRVVILSRADFTTAILAGDTGSEHLRTQWRHSWDTYKQLRAAVRADLGVDPADQHPERTTTHLPKHP
jgi:hypothetical protein